MTAPIEDQFASTFNIDRWDALALLLLTSQVFPIGSEAAADMWINANRSGKIDMREVADPRFTAELRCWLTLIGIEGFPRFVRLTMLTDTIREALWKAAKPYDAY